MTYAVTKAADGTYSIACDGYLIVSGLTHAELKAMVEELDRLTAEMEAASPRSVSADTERPITRRGNISQEQ